MTTAHIHSLAQNGLASLVKSASAKIAMLKIPAIRVQRKVMGVSFAQWLMEIHRIHRTRLQLATLDSRLLADIGISEAEREAELRKSFLRIRGRGR